MILLNGEQINITIFPDHTSQVWKIDDDLGHHQALITWHFDSEEELIHVAQLKHLLDKQFTTSLNIPYLPYARQDKEVSNTTTFALTTFAHLINSLNFEHVFCLDAHSDIAKKLINNLSVSYPKKELAEAIGKTHSDMVCYPDYGATSKYSNIYDYPFVYGNKVRDQLTGNITKYDLIGNVKDKTMMIVDDICDGGMTFKLLTKDLLLNGAKEVNLFVTHGLFTKGVTTLYESGIKNIFVGNEK